MSSFVEDIPDSFPVNVGKNELVSLPNQTFAAVQLLPSNNGFSYPADDTPIFSEARRRESTLEDTRGNEPRLPRFGHVLEHGIQGACSASSDESHWNDSRQVPSVDFDFSGALQPFEVPTTPLQYSEGPHSQSRHSGLQNTILSRESIRPLSVSRPPMTSYSRSILPRPHQRQYPMAPQSGSHHASFRNASRVSKVKQSKRRGVTKGIPAQNCFTWNLSSNNKNARSGQQPKYGCLRCQTNSIKVSYFFVRSSRQLLTSDLVSWIISLQTLCRLGEEGLFVQTRGCATKIYPAMLRYKFREVECL